MDERIKYHLTELEIALNPRHPRHSLPEIRKEDKSILDVGCGIGQTFIASQIAKEAFVVGIDIDLTPLKFGKQFYHGISYINAEAGFLPFKNEIFDLAVSRVTLPYTNIPRCIQEIARILKLGGRIWITLIPFSAQVKHLVRSIVSVRVKDIVFRLYVIINGVVLRFGGRVFSFPWKKKYESFQTKYASRRILKACGFKRVEISTRRHFLITAEKY
jgi:ubiquinone/menaquinone biosynthesis C-methylase UbiE